MKKNEIKKSKIYPVLVLESVISGRNLDRLVKLLETLFLLLVIATLSGSMIISKFGVPDADRLTRLLEFRLLGTLSLVLALLLVVFMIRSYLRSSYYFENIINNRYHGKDLYSFTVGRILYRSPGDDWLAGFLLSDTGRLILARCGISQEEIKTFLASRQPESFPLELSEEKILKLRDFVSRLYKENEDLSRLLYGVGISVEDLLAVTDWVVKGIEEGEMRARWWRRENLERLGSIGKSWSYGATPRLDLYSTDLLDNPAAQFSAYELSFRQPEIRQIENILSKRSEANVLLVGDNDTIRRDVLWSFVREIKFGSILPELEHKRVLLFNSSLFLSSFKDRESFEREVISIMDEVTSAGDVILVIDDLAGFLMGAESLPSQVYSLLDPYLSSSRLQVIAMADTDKFHRVIEMRSEVMTRFDTVMLSEFSAEEAVSALLPVIDLIERKDQIFFSYQALKQAVIGAESYLTGGGLADRSKDLIEEIVPWFIKTGRKHILPADITAYLSEKTKIPLGAISEEEKKILLNLEESLHQKVIGQEPAIRAIAGALKRGRAGVVNSKRPLGSFLFLGPTGVGKTETAKALATTYFGGEEKLLRLDMTEYQDDGSLDKLIGSFDTGKPGVLTSLIRQNIYGVMLLDEFEKSSLDVRNLFLQILDEGIFSDMDGKKVNARNIIFIATSNAGSETIWKMVREGKNPAAAKDEIIDEIVHGGVFKPELLNRFDDCVIFHPLTPENLKSIAELMLGRLAKRLEVKGINFVANDWLIGLVSSEGSNEVFGARPMNRYIQDKVEQAIAEKMIEGSLKPGMSVELKPPANDAPGEYFLEIK